ncbi:hypothetical protein KR084_012334 [Drosophila pseudotakahashii]|nr:hypothetical protein KR084_012334 [Drosophila pseudotakahashii]
MRYYEDPCGYPARHHHGRPNIEIDVVPGWGGGYYPPPPPPRPTEVVYMSTPAATYMPGTQMIVQQQQAYGYPYPQQQYEYQYQQYQQQPYAYNNPPYQQW